MPVLRQDESYLIGTAQAIKALEKKDKAYVLVISDSHGDYDRFYALLEACGSKLDALIFCGDGSFDLVGIIEAMANESPDSPLPDKILPPVIAFVRGNGDAESYSYTYKGKNEVIIAPQAQNLTICGKKIFVAHGHKYSVDFGLDYAVEIAEKLGLDYFFYGHTHIPREKKLKNTWFINPGSCSRPRGGFPPTCALLKLYKDEKEAACHFYEIKENRFGNVDLKPMKI